MKGAVKRKNIRVGVLRLHICVCMGLFNQINLSFALSKNFKIHFSIIVSFFPFSLVSHGLEGKQVFRSENGNRPLKRFATTTHTHGLKLNGFFNTSAL